MRVSGPSAPRAPGRVLRWVAAAVLAGSLLRLGVVVAAQLAWPFDLRYETPNLCTVQVIRDGGDPYSPSTYAAAPFVLTQYAPAYLWLVAWLPSVPGRPFLVGRCVSVVAMLTVAALLFLVDGRGTQRALAALAAGWFFLLHATLAHTADFRVDALALALSIGSLVLLVGGGRWRVMLAALLCSLAVATRQSSVAAAGAGLVFLWLSDRRAALRFGGLVALLLGGGALAATLSWGEGFWFSLLAATRQPRSLELFATQWGLMLRQPAFLLVVVAGTWAAVTSLKQRPLQSSPWLAYALVSGAVLLVTSSTIGTHEGHFLEFGAALLCWLVFALGRRADARRDGRRVAAPAALLLCAAIAVHELVVIGTDAPGLALPSGPEAELTATRHASLRASFDARGIAHGDVLSLGSTRDAACVAERVCLSPAWLYDQLWTTGDLSHVPLLEALRRGAFDLVVVASSVPFPPQSESHRSRDEVLRAVAEFYDPLGEDAILRYFRRRD